MEIRYFLQGRYAMEIDMDSPGKLAGSSCQKVKASSAAQNADPADAKRLWERWPGA
jgi:hypothetical protein